MPNDLHPQVVVICGRNKQLLDKLRGRPMPRGLHVHACGFVDNIHEWMGACDAIITKVHFRLRCFSTLLRF